MGKSEEESLRAASEEVSQEFNTLVNADDLDSLKQLQHLMEATWQLGAIMKVLSTIFNHLERLDMCIRSEDRLGRLQDCNAVLSHFNDYSENCFAEVSCDFAKHTRLLKSMKSDLDYIFLKLRSIKARILATYPDAFPDSPTREALDRRPDLEMP
ncbi:putative domain KxDL, partial [Dillenia turbinata]